MSDSLPHNIEAEQAALGALLVNNDVLPRLGVLEPRHFYDPVHSRIFAAAVACINEGRVASPVTLKFALQDDAGLHELGGPAYLVRLAGAAISLIAAKDYADIIRDLWARRELAVACEEAAAAVSRPDSGVEKVAAQLEHRIAATLNESGAAPSQSFMRSLTEAVRQANDAACGELVGVSTGLHALDMAIGLLRPGRVYVLAARPSMGKSTVAWRIAHSVAATGAPVIFASLEMQEVDLTNRALSMLLRERGLQVPYFNIEAGRLSEAEHRALIDVAKANAERPIRTIGPSKRDLGRLTLAIRSAAKSFGKPVGLVAIDYLQLIQVAEARSSFERVGAASKAVKWLATDLGCPVVLLSQLNRQVEERDDKRPRLSDLRQSGEIEEDADTVLFLYRHEYYCERMKAGADSATIAKLAAEAEGTRDKLEIIVAKNRSGPIETVAAYCEMKHNFVVDQDQAPKAVQGAMDFA